MIESVYIDTYQLHGAGVVGLQAFSGLGSPTVRADRIERARTHGAVDYTEHYGGRVFSLEGLIAGSTAAEAMQALDELKGVLRLDGSDRVLKFTRQGYGYAERCLVRLAGPLDAAFSPESDRLVKFGFELFAADPRIYRDATVTATWDPTTAAAGSGVEFPLVFPLDFEGATVAHLEVTCEGTFPTPPTFVVTGPIDDPIIDNDTTGDSIDLTGLSLAAGDEVTVDVAARDVIDSGTSRPDYVVASTTTWWELQPGTNLIRLRGSSASAGVTQLAVTYREATI